MNSAAAASLAKLSGKTCYQGKSVEFLCEANGRLLLLTGTFFTAPETRDLEIHYTGRIQAHHLPLTQYVFRLSTAHLHAVVKTKEGSGAEYFLERPIRLPANRRIISIPEEELVGAGSESRAERG